MKKTTLKSAKLDKSNAEKELEAACALLDNDPNKPVQLSKAKEKIKAAQDALNQAIVRRDDAKHKEDAARERKEAAKKKASDLQKIKIDVEKQLNEVRTQLTNVQSQLAAIDNQPQQVNNKSQGKAGNAGSKGIIGPEGGLLAGALAILKVIGKVNARNLNQHPIAQKAKWLSIQSLAERGLSYVEGALVGQALQGTPLHQFAILIKTILSTILGEAKENVEVHNRELNEFKKEEKDMQRGRAMPEKQEINSLFQKK